jgi:aspartyl-tRNA synthetase
VAALRVRRRGAFPKQIDDYAQFAARHGAKGLAWIKVNDSSSGLQGLQSPIAKFLDDKAWQGLARATSVESGDLLFFGAGDWLTVSKFMGQLRVRVALDLDQVAAGWQPLWVTGFPMFEYDDNAKRYLAMHHPFTAPLAAEPESLMADPAGALSKGYDMVLNGSEIGGGSIRIHNPQMQQAVFPAWHWRSGGSGKIRVSSRCTEVRRTAPRGHCFWADRIAALMSGEDSIRDVLPFPRPPRRNACSPRHLPGSRRYSLTNCIHCPRED